MADTTESAAVNCVMERSEALREITKKAHKVIYEQINKLGAYKENDQESNYHNIRKCKIKCCEEECERQDCVVGIHNRRLAREQHNEIRYWIAVLPREVRELIIAKTLPPKMILQYFPHAMAARILKDAVVNPYNEDYVGEFDYFRGIWVKAGQIYESYEKHFDAISNIGITNHHVINLDFNFTFLTPEFDFYRDCAEVELNICCIDAAVRVCNVEAIRWCIEYHHFKPSLLTLEIAINTGNLAIYKIIKNYYPFEKLGRMSEYEIVIIAVRGKYIDILLELMFDFKITASRIIEIFAGRISENWEADNRPWGGPWNRQYRNIQNKHYNERFIMNKILDDLIECPENHPANEIDNVISNVIKYRLYNYLEVLCLRGLITDEHIDSIISEDCFKLFATIFKFYFNYDIDAIITALARHGFPHEMTSELFALDFECTLPRITIMICNCSNANNMMYYLRRALSRNVAPNRLASSSRE